MKEEKWQERRTIKIVDEKGMKKGTNRKSVRKLTSPSMIKVKLSPTAYRPDSTLWMQPVRPLQGQYVDGQK
jgi:hypothetical protein